MDIGAGVTKLYLTTAYLTVKNYYLFAANLLKTRSQTPRCYTIRPCVPPHVISRQTALDRLNLVEPEFFIYASTIFGRLDPCR